MKSAQEQGLAHIRYGAALMNPNTTLSELSDLAFDCGLQIGFEITSVKSESDSDGEAKSREHNNEG